MKLSYVTGLVFNHLVRAGSISQREAVIEYSVGSLTKEISRLRERGVQIRTVLKTHPITGKSYARYMLD
jgi:hypothetical protein